MINQFGTGFFFFSFFPSLKEATLHLCSLRSKIFQSTQLTLSLCSLAGPSTFFYSSNIFLLLMLLGYYCPEGTSVSFYMLKPDSHPGPGITLPVDLKAATLDLYWHYRDKNLVMNLSSET